MGDLPGCQPGILEVERQQLLLEMYRDFVMSLLRGIYIMHLTSNDETSNTHCQLMSDMRTLKIDKGNSTIIEFPLVSVSRVYRMIRKRSQAEGQALLPEDCEVKL